MKIMEFVEKLYRKTLANDFYWKVTFKDSGEADTFVCSNPNFPVTIYNDKNVLNVNGIMYEYDNLERRILDKIIRKTLNKDDNLETIFKLMS